HLGNKDTRWLLQAGLRRGDELRNRGGKGGYGPERTQMNPLHFKENSVLLKLEHDLSARHRIEASGEGVHYKSTIQKRRDQGPEPNFAIEKNLRKETIKRERLLLGYRYQANGDLATIDHGYVKGWWQLMPQAAG